MPVDTIAIWMYFAITAVICGKVITGTVLNKQRKELATIHEKLRAVRLDLEHASERKKATENVTSFQERWRDELPRLISESQQALRDRSTSADDAAPKESTDPMLPRHLRVP